MMIDSYTRRSTHSFHVMQSDSRGDKTHLFDGMPHRDRGITLSGAEIRDDLIKLFHYLNISLTQYEEGSSPFLKTHVEALLYAERVATHAVHDYPRRVEGEPQITLLWEILHRIRRTISTWRTGEYSGDGQTELTIVEHIIQNTLREV